MFTDFRHVPQRLQQRIDEIGHTIVRSRKEITSWRVFHGEFDKGFDKSIDDSEWQALENWNDIETPSWFKTTVVIPEEFNGLNVSLSLKVGGYLHSLFNAEGLIYVNEELVQGIDAYHYDIPLATFAEAGKSYSVAIFIFWKPDFDKTEWTPTSRKPHPDIQPLTEIQVIDKTTETFYFDISTAFDIANTLPEDSLERVRMLTCLDRALLCVDFRGLHDEDFYKSIVIANTQLRKELFNNQLNPNRPTALAVAQTHIDLAWFWPIDVNRYKIGRSVATVLDLMDRYPDFTFMQNQAKVYEYLQDDFPDLYSSVKDRVHEGRWEVNGGMWTEPDTNMPSGESLIRQITFGIRYFKKEFDKVGQALIIMDAFGYSWALPQLLRRAGLKYFLTNKMSWNQFNRLPYDSFIWQGIDGSRVIAHQLTAKNSGGDGWTTTCNALLNPEMLDNSWDMYQQKDQNDQVLFTYGYGDGGGGPTTQMLETAKRVRELDASVNLQHGTIQGYFENLGQRFNEGRPHVWNKELYLELHRGTYTSKAAIKKGNRKGEVSLHDAELFASLANILVGETYPRDNIFQAWDLLLVNQQHDILPGSITREPELDALRDYSRLQEITSNIIDNSIEAIANRVATENDSIIVFNPNAWSRNGIIEINTDRESELTFMDSNGRILTHQVSNDDSSKILVQVNNVPACGYTTVKFDSIKTEHVSSMSISERRMENAYFVLEIDKSGHISSLYDKIHKREIIDSDSVGNVFQIFEDRPLNYDAWDIDRYFDDKISVIDQFDSVRVIENGPVRGTVEIRKTFSSSSIVQRIQIFEGIPRIDFDTEIEWGETNTLLKVAFPVAINSLEATYEIQFGNVERPTHRSSSLDQAQFEACAQKWVDLSEGDYGISLLNDCKYGYDVEGNVIRLTLLRSPKAPDPQTDQGSHQFTYSLFPHSGDWRNGSIQAGYELNYPFTIANTGMHEGNLPKEFSLVSTNKDGVFIETVKLGEDSDNLIVRLYEGHNTRGSFDIKIGVPISDGNEVNLLEEFESPINLDSDSINTDIKPYEVRTFELEIE